MDLGLKDKVVVCMSSASGFGKGIATEFAREQRDLWSGHLRRRRHDHRVLSLSSQHTLISLTGKRQRLKEPLPFPIPFTDR